MNTLPSSRITYEQPLDELMRFCLRAEHLLKLSEEDLKAPSQRGARGALANLSRLLIILERPDLKTKLVKALLVHAHRLTRLEGCHQVDQKKLTSVLTELDQVIDLIQSTYTNFGQKLRDNEFLTQIRQKLNNPAGLSTFNLPAYHLWLNSPEERRQVDLDTWFSEIYPLKKAIGMLLDLTRQSSKPVLEQVEQGSLQKTLDSTLNWQLIRVALPLSLSVYPEISVGKHRLSIRFFQFNSQHKSVGFDQNFECYITYCGQ